MADEVLFFANPTDFRAWLEKSHDTVDEQWVGFYKVSIRGAAASKH